ncbi:MAG TPA: glycosyltransferase [Bacteroidia bacterium]
MQTKVLVSVIIPCYNVAPYIEECIDSVLKQTYKELEIICIDNNSSDNTLEILCNQKAKYPELIIEQEKTAGANAARNKGLLLAKGAWIQFLDADDLLMPGKIEHQLHLLPADTNTLAFIAGAWIKRDVKGNEKENNHIEESVFIAPFINKSGNTCSNLWNKNFLDKVHGWNLQIKSSQEADLMLRLVLSGGTFIPDRTPLTIVRERETGQISHRNPADKWKQFVDIRLDYMDQLGRTNAGEYKKWKDHFFDFLMVSIITLARYNREEAEKYYKKYIKANWISANTYGFTKAKVNFIKLFGLRAFLALTKNNR